MIGDSLRGLRKKNKLTLQEVAERTNLSIAYISNIENNKTSPTLDAFEKICRVLQANMAEVFKNAHSFQNVVRKSERVQIYHNNLQIKYELMTTMGRVMRGTCMTISGDQFQENISWGHDNDEYTIVNEGEVKFTLHETEEYILYPGDAIYIPANTPHRFQKLNEGEAVLYIVVAYNK